MNGLNALEEPTEPVTNVQELFIHVSTNEQPDEFRDASNESDMHPKTGHRHYAMTPL